MLARLLAIIQKEFIQTLRDRGALAIMISIPLLQLILFGYAINMNVQHIPLVAVDQSLDDASRAYLDDLTNSGYFDLVKVVPSQAAAVREIDLNQASAAVVIPPDFASNVRRGQADVLVLVDGSDLFTSLSAYNAANLIGQTHATRAALQKIERSGITGVTNPLEVHLNILYNPDFKDLWFIIPGIIALLLQTQTIVLTATSVVREREVGTIEQILVTPIRPMEFMLGKIAPNIVLVMVNVLTILAIAVFWFKVPFQGSFWLFISLSFLYAFSGLGLGLLISTVSQNNRQAMQLVMFISLLSIIIGGFIFPRYTMPGILQAIGNLFPLTYFVPISRGIITKGIGAQFLVVEILALVGYIVVIMIIAARAFRQRLD